MSGFNDLPEELKRFIFKLAGPLTQYLNDRLDLTSTFNKRLIRRDAISMGWRGDYSELFDTVNPDSNCVTEIADIFINKSKTFHEWLVHHLESNSKTSRIVQHLNDLGWTSWWEDVILTCDANQIDKHYRNALEFRHVAMIEYLMTDEKMNTKLIPHYTGAYLTEIYFWCNRFWCVGNIDPFHKPALTQMLWSIIRNVKFNDPSRAMDCAAMIGDIDLVKWTHKNIYDCWTHDSMNYAALCGHLDVIKWIHVNQPEACKTNAMDFAAWNGHLPVVQWLHSNRTEGCSTKAMDYAAENGHLHVVKWLHEHRNEGCTQDAMDLAAKNGHLDVVKWLHENRQEGCSTDAMNWATRRGHFEVVRWLFDKYPELFEFSRAKEVAEYWRHDNILEWMNETVDGVSNNTR